MEIMLMMKLEIKSCTHANRQNCELRLLQEQDLTLENAPNRTIYKTK